MLRKGDHVPAFELNDQAGSLVTRDGLLESGPFVIYFYPANFSPG